jgi:C-terminal processing protease CtpA/Prc
MFEITIVVPNSAGAIAGLKTGDRISSINSQPVSQLSPSDALVIFGGPVGSNVDLLVTPKGGDAARSMPIQLKELLPYGCAREHKTASVKICRGRND